MKLLNLLLPSLLMAQALETVPVTQKVLSHKSSLPAEIYPFLKVSLQARVAGFVEVIDVDRGSLVTRGQALVKLSAPELAAQIAEAEAKARSVESQKAEAEAKLAAARSTFERLRTASAVPGVVAANELVLAEKAVDALKEQIKAIETAAEAARSSIRPLREMESYLDVKAPFDGIITERFVHPGALVGPAAGPLVTLEQHAKLRLVVAVPEADAGSITRGAEVSFRVPAYPGQIFAGSVSRISHTVDPKTRTMPVEVDVANPRHILAPGMYADAQWPIRRTRPSLLVPPTAVVTTTERSFVIRTSGGRAEWVTVAKGGAAGELVEVMGALAPGDLVVRRATDEIRDGSAINALGGKPAGSR
jgi:RND family efflux transporter MFP subunit